MLRPIIISILCVSLFIVGCTRQSKSGQEADNIAPPSASTLSKPQSSQDAIKPSQTQDFAAGQTLVIDVDSTAELGGVVRSIFQDTRGNLWVGGEGDLFRNDGRVLTSYDIKDDLGNGVTIKRIIEDKDGNIWCGTTGGITRIDGKSFTSFGEKDGLISRDVWSIAVDANGMIWIGTIEGVCRFDGKTFTAFAIPQAEPDHTRGVTSGKIVHCITVDRKGHVWFGTNGGAYIFDGKALTNISEKDGLSNDAVHNILEDKSGNIWFGTTHKGICRFEIWCIHVDRSGKVWFSGKHFGVYRYDGNDFTNFNEKDGMASPGLMSILEDNKGRLWLGGVQGLFRYDGESFVRVTKNGPWQ